MNGVQGQFKLVSGFLNGENNPAPGVPLASPSGSIVPDYTGMVGSKIYIDDATALRLSLTTTGTLLAGVYQMVKFKEAVTRGQIVFWDIAVSYSLYQVTTDESAVPSAKYKAGICLNVVSAGQWGIIQVGGRASVDFRTVLTSPGAIGSSVFCAAAGAGADNGNADVIDDASNPTFTDMADALARFLGVAEAAPVGGAISVVGLAAFMDRQ